MTAYTRNGRFIRLAAVGGSLLVAGVAWAGPAGADASSYLRDLHNAGIRDVDGGDAALLQVGTKLCTQVSYGVSPATLKTMALQRSDATLGAGGLTPAQANELVNYAVADLCPNY
ncbi:hypothetical protein AWB91_01005 [Mycobacterium paraense]|jgi:hypothetical protein|uniref:DUF732 domain-containing protein n=1 Tax=Mycobacterium paraense TaxID=767916 RepID=A0A1X2A5D3_9MYCO|nr:DUF732 domain-containing protein [Mycobacterium paraense]MCV7441964.1 DUF732 domain-containing protein [Mycobacterium paraense]ORW34173.1 hypothetical protein AWB91_01005 [Mycobacterium paraense]ORW37453.1 hypothetical protein AWB88_22860 [Mycobacterium paraense]ORW40684.1 hypothetical protein AWB90_22400 [Mycobacterium paraense]ORW40983.1 hypothetical protein AWB89_20840 [Mycobacterium paraense]